MTGDNQKLLDAASTHGPLLVVDGVLFNVICAGCDLPRRVVARITFNTYGSRRSDLCATCLADRVPMFFNEAASVLANIAGVG